MLSEFFFAQWGNPVKLNYTTEVKENLIELGLPTNLEVIKSMSKYAFTKLVKKHAKEYEFDRFFEIKRTKSKMKDLFYNQLKLQD